MRMRIKSLSLASMTALCAIVLVLALVVGRLFVLQSQAAPHLPQHIKPQINLPPKYTSSVSATPISSQDPPDSASLASWRDKLSTLHYLHGPNGWMWSTGLSSHRLVVFY